MPRSDPKKAHPSYASACPPVDNRAQCCAQAIHGRSIRTGSRARPSMRRPNTPPTLAPWLGFGRNSAPSASARCGAGAERPSGRGRCRASMSAPSTARGQRPKRRSRGCRSASPTLRARIRKQSKSASSRKSDRSPHGFLGYAGDDLQIRAKLRPKSQITVEPKS